MWQSQVSLAFLFFFLFTNNYSCRFGTGLSRLPIGNPQVTFLPVVGYALLPHDYHARHGQPGEMTSLLLDKQFC